MKQIEQHISNGKKIPRMLISIRCSFLHFGNGRAQQLLVHHAGWLPAYDIPTLPVPSLHDPFANCVSGDKDALIQTHKAVNDKFDCGLA